MLKFPYDTYADRVVEEYVDRVVEEFRKITTSDAWIKNFARSLEECLDKKPPESGEAADYYDPADNGNQGA